MGEAMKPVEHRVRITCPLYGTESYPPAQMRMAIMVAFALHLEELVLVIAPEDAK